MMVDVWWWVMSVEMIASMSSLGAVFFYLAVGDIWVIAKMNPIGFILEK